MLKPQEDAYGQMIWDYHHGKRPVEICERDDGRIDVSGGAPSYFAEFHDWPAHHRRAMKFVHGHVLDVGCGAGSVLFVPPATRPQCDRH
jgi:2-polyprenyl-3-methyl-5-hydroxy-6-metoxy-1,4-benzoquinol methylase